MSMSGGYLHLERGTLNGTDLFTISPRDLQYW
jgi:hypothetical protein